MVDMTQFWQVVAIPVISGLFGWFKNAAEDGEFSKYEIGKGIKTLITLGLPAVAIWLALDGFGIDVSAYAVALIPVVVYWTLKLLKLPDK